jgi:hypothetical protein
MSNTNKPSAKKGMILGLLALFIFIGVGSYENNDITTVKVTKYINGTMRVVTTPGPYMEWFGSTTTYNKAGELHFSGNKEEGGSGFGSRPVNVTFNRKSSADVSGFLKYTLPLDTPTILALHTKYGSNDAIKTELVRTSLEEALVQTGPLFTAEEADAPRRDQFKTYAKGQLKDGMYKKNVQIVNQKDPSDPKRTISRQVTSLVLLDGAPVVVEASSFAKYHLGIDSFTIRDLDWDEVTDDLLVQTKKIDMKRILSKAAAVTAQQNAIKEKAEGAARIAIANANALVLKKTAVIEQEKLKEVAVLTAQKLYEVEKLSAKTALEEAKKIRANGLAKAAANQALVRAGLTPEKKALIDKDMKIGMMREWAKRSVPATVISTGGNNGSGTVMDFLSIEAAQKMVKKMGTAK